MARDHRNIFTILRFPFWLSTFGSDGSLVHVMAPQSKSRSTWALSDERELSATEVIREV